MPAHYIAFLRDLIAVHYHTQVVHSLHHKLTHLASYRHRIHTIHIFPSTECWY